MCGSAVREAEIEYGIDLTPRQAWDECVIIVDEDNFDWVGNCDDCLQIQSQKT